MPERTTPPGGAAASTPERTARAFDASPVPVLVVDRHYRIAGLNAAAQRLSDWRSLLDV